jgi:uncharacterized protein YodC (DUF2158 family)
MTIDKFVWNPVKEEPYTDLVECVWFDGTTLKRKTFKTSSLELE